MLDGSLIITADNTGINFNAGTYVAVIVLTVVLLHELSKIIEGVGLRRYVRVEDERYVRAALVAYILLVASTPLVVVLSQLFAMLLRVIGKFI